MRQSTVEQIVSALNQGEVKYLIAGGLAVVAYGYLRLTADVDIVLDLERSNVLAAMNALRRLGYQPKVPVQAEDFANEQLRRQWVREKGMVVFSMISNEHPETDIDFFVEEPFDFEGEYAAAPRMEVAEGLAAPFVGLDRLIEMKSEAARPQDLDDLEKLKQIREIQTDGQD